MKINYSIKIILALFISTLISIFMRNLGIDKESILMVYLVGVLIVPVVTRGYFYGAITSIVSVLVFNFLFTNPIHTFLIDNTSDVTLLIFFLIASLISSSLASRFKNQLIISKNKEKTARLLYEITNSFLKITGKKNIIMQGINYIYEHTGYISKIMIIDDDETYAYANINVDLTCMSSMNLDIQSVNKKLGIIKIFYKEDIISIDDELLIKMVVNQIGVSLDREYIYNERQNIRVQMESEHLRSNLLRGISHDLRTPLTGIVGASGVVIENIDKLDLMSIKKMVKDINEESLYLSNLVENILNMTRIGEGRLVLQKQDEVVDDIINESIRHVSGMLNGRKIEVKLPNEVVTIAMDGRLIVQVLINLLNNSIRHTKEDGIISLRVLVREDFIIFEVEDNGEGIDEKIKENIFESFVSSRSSKKVIDGKRGMGIGLSICKSIINAHDGEIYAENKTIGNGAIFRFTLPFVEE